MNNQKMTNEERQDLIEWLQGEKSVSYQQNVKFIRLAREIALAALTAEPVAYYWFNESDYGHDVSLTSPEEDDDAADALENGWQVEPLIRIPKLTGGDEC